MEKQKEQGLLKGDETVGVDSAMTSDLLVEEESTHKIESPQETTPPVEIKVEEGETIFSSEEVNKGNISSEAVLFEEKLEDSQDEKIESESEEEKRLIRRTKQSWWAEKSKGMKILLGVLPLLLIALGLLTWSLSPVDSNSDQKQLFIVKKK